jgi:hypothetical protein
MTTPNACRLPKRPPCATSAVAGCCVPTSALPISTRLAVLIPTAPSESQQPKGVVVQLGAALVGTRTSPGLFERRNSTGHQFES